MAKRKLQWSAGGLDVTATRLQDLQQIDVPPEVPSRQARTFLERAGYTVRHKLTKREIGYCAKTEGTWVCVDAEECAKLYARHRDMLLAANKMLDLARPFPQPLPSIAAEVAIHWWHDEQDCENLSDNAVMGLRTAYHIAGLQPVLYGYKKHLNLPSGVQYKDATEALSLDEFKHYRQNYAAALVADLARLRGIKKAVDDGAIYV